MRILTIIGLILLFVALLINPIAPVLSSVPLPTSIDIPAGDQSTPLSQGQHAGWQIAFKDNGMVARGVDFFFVPPSKPSSGIVVVSANVIVHTTHPVYTFNVAVAAKVHVDLPDIAVYGETWSFEYGAGDSNAVILQERTPPAASTDTYRSITPVGNSVQGGVAFGLSGTKDVFVPPVEAQFSYSANNLKLTVHDESKNADAVNVSWGDHTFSNGAPGDTLTHTYASSGTYQVSLNARGGTAHDSAVADIAVSQGTQPVGDTGPKPDLRLIAFAGLAVIGVALLLLSWRLRR